MILYLYYKRYNIRKDLKKEYLLGNYIRREIRTRNMGLNCRTDSRSGLRQLTRKFAVAQLVVCIGWSTSSHQKLHLCLLIFFLNFYINVLNFCMTRKYMYYVFFNVPKFKEYISYVKVRI